jgi:hypothetical protein
LAPAWLPGFPWPPLGNSKRTDVLYYKMTYKTRFL